MTATYKFSFKALLAGAFLALACGQVSAAVEVGGHKYEDSLNVAGKDLVLNGAGIRTKFVFKVYSAGLYLQSKESTVDGVMKADGPRRIRLVMMRDITSDEFGSAFMSGLNNNVSPSDKSKIVGQISKYGEMFGQIDAIKKGDTLDTDWIPGVGTQCYLNGKKIGSVIPDIIFYNSVLRIWLGDKPADSTLKTKLLAAGPK
jgi:hypothetical protein